MSTQLQLPLFPPDIMEKVKEGHRLAELERLRRELEHVKHQRDGYHGAYNKIKQQFNEQVKSSNASGAPGAVASEGSST